MTSRTQRILGGILSISIASGFLQTAFAIGPEVSVVKIGLHNLIAYTEDGDQPLAQGAWRSIVKEGTSEDLVDILAAMGKGNIVSNLKAPAKRGPLTINWLRAAFDTIAERTLNEGEKLPTDALNKFVLNLDRNPRARRLAYEWLAKVDPTTPDRLLSNMLDDPSLELRYDAIARLLDEAKQASGDAAAEKYLRALKSARDKGQLRACADALKELGQETDMAAQMGFLTNWKVIGPFANTDRAGFDEVLPPETAIDLTAEYRGKDDVIKWIDAEAEQKNLDDLGKVDFNAALVEEKSVLAYAFTTFVASEARDAECRYESKEATKLWVNGEEVAVNNVYHSGSGFDQHIIPVKLRKGENQILIKVCQNEQTQPWTRPWDFRLRITDSLGGAIEPAK